MKRIGWVVIMAAVAIAVVIVVSAGGSSDDSTGSGDKSAKRSAPGATEQSPPKKVTGPHRDPVPILMYHVIASPPAGVPYGELYVPAATFKAQIDELAKRGYHGVTMQQLDDYWRKGYALPSKPVVLTFDDGYQSQFTTAMPAMRKHGWPGVLYLALKNLEPEAGGITPRMVHALKDSGWEIDAHTISHLDVTTLDAAGLNREIAGSRKAIQRKFKVPVNSFCYPAGRYDDAAVAAVEAAGFQTATTTEPGLARPGQPFTLARVRVNGSDSAKGLASELESLGS